MRVAFGCDHAGFALKAAVLSFFKKQNVAVDDVGVDGAESSVDYPDFAGRVAEAVARRRADWGILCCGTGIGMSIAANKVKGIRAAVVWDAKTARLAREHNWANVLCLGGRVLTPTEAVAALRAYFKASQEARHRQRIQKIKRLEKHS